MTILITNLEDCVEDMTDDEMQHVSGGTRHIVKDKAVGAGNLLSSLGQRFALAATYVGGTLQDPTTRRIRIG